mmetsp:Transcript_16223/g.52495  ORF Transcript_16223/g.52495 Transcript_16223/m.52495 type:complete len:234 (+) Transcript_16223:154-855(+)
MIDKVVDLGIAVAYYLTLGEQQHEDVRWVRRATLRRGRRRGRRGGGQDVAQRLFRVRRLRHAQAWTAAYHPKARHGPSSTPVQTGKPIDGDFAMLHGKPLHTACHLKDYGVLCAGCGRLIDGRADPGFVVAGDKSYHSACFKCAECGVSLAAGAPYHLVAGAAYCKLHDRRRKITRDKLKVNSTTGEEFYVEAGTGRKYRHAPTADGRGGKEYFEDAAPPALGGASTWRQDAP